MSSTMFHHSASRRCRVGKAALLAIAVLLPGQRAIGQEATNTPAATQPGVGSWYLRHRVQYLRLRDDPSPQQRDIDKVLSTTSLTYGITRDLSATLAVPVALSVEDPSGPAGTDTDFELGDADLSLKWRPFQRDLSPVDSVRLAFFGGVEVPTGTGDLGSDSWDPYVGSVFTTILGRHGFNQSISYKFNTGGEEFSVVAGDGPSNALRYDTAYLFRLDPAEYTADTTAATYLTLELNGLYETNGDNEILFGPGLLYEARTFALEATVGLPIVQDIDHRPSTDIRVTLGFRLLF